MKQEKNIPTLLIIPDIHGRLYWMSATRKYPKLPVIFLGDYLDPYTYYEGIFPSEARSNFNDILSFKRANMERVTLLLGNHDIHYYDEYLDNSRKDKENYELIHDIFSKNHSLFRLAMSMRIGKRAYLFTHAGIDPKWLEYRMPRVPKDDADAICTSLNDKMKDEAVFFDFVCNGLMDISASRWGRAKYPSPVWADVEDHECMEERLPGIYQVFGHTQQEFSPVITKQYACLDCRKAFLLTSNGEFVEV